MARQFKPVRFFVLAALVAFFACGVTAFYTHRASYGLTPEERAGYAAGSKAGSEASRNAKLPNAAELNMMAQKRFKTEGSGNQQDWHLGFEKGYEEAFRKTHAP
jgi:hypothetical protein